MSLRRHFGLLSSRHPIPTVMFDQFLKHFHSPRDVSSRMRFIHLENLVLVWTEMQSVQNPQQVEINFYQNEQLAIVGEANHLHYSEAGVASTHLDGALSVHALFARIADLYLDKGETGLSQLRGDFALLIYDKVNRILTGLRSPYATPSIYYHHDGENLLISSRMGPIIKAAHLNIECNPYKVVSSMCLLPQYDDHSFFTGINQLPAGQKISSMIGARPVLSKWMGLHPDRNNVWNDWNDGLSACRKLFDQAIDRSLPVSKNFASEFSGGVDSTSVSAIALARNRQGQIPWLYANTPDCSLPMSEKERLYLADLERIRSHLPDHKLLSVPPKLYSEAQLEEFFHEWHEPPQRAYSLLVQIGLEHAREQGISVILSGYGGDQLLTAHPRHYFYEKLKTGQWGRLDGEMRERRLLHVRRRILKWYLRQQILRMPYGAKILSLKSKKSAINHILSTSFIKKDKIRDLRLDQFVGDLLLPPPIDFQHSLYRSVEEDGIVQQQCQARNRIAGMFDLSYRYPLLDNDLITHALRYPAQKFVEDGEGRQLIKHLVSDRLPYDQLIQKSQGTLVTIAGLYQYMPAIATAFRRSLDAIDATHPAAEWFDTELLHKKLTIYEKTFKDTSFPHIHYAILVAKFLQWQVSR